MHATDQHPALNAAPSAYVYPLLVGQLLTHARGADAGRQIVYRGDVRHSYAQFRERIGRLAGALAALGVGADAIVAVMDWDSHRYLESYFAIPMMGATLFTVNVRLSPRQIAHTLRDARASVVVAHADFLPLLEQVRDALGDSTCVIVACDGGAMPATSLPLAGEYERLVAAADPDYPFADFDENARAVLFYTTGTTGDPKGVCYSHRQIVLHALATAAALGAARDGQRLHRDDVYMPITPMFHVMAWGMPYIAVMLGLKIVLPGRYRAHALLDLRQAERVTFSHCVPAVLQMLLDEARLRACDLSGWKMIVGGSALPASLCRAARARRIDVFAGYGMSETGPVVALAQLRGTEGASMSMPMRMPVSMLMSAPVSMSMPMSTRISMPMPAPTRPIHPSRPPPRTRTTKPPSAAPPAGRRRSSSCASSTQRCAMCRATAAPRAKSYCAGRRSRSAIVAIRRRAPPCGRAAICIHRTSR